MPPSGPTVPRPPHYLSGGRPTGSRRDYPGCRDSTPLVGRSCSPTGTLCFGGESGAWGGGMAFFVPGDSGVVHARAYLLQHDQLGDLIAQEARRPVGSPWSWPRPGPAATGSRRCTTSCSTSVASTGTGW